MQGERCDVVLCAMCYIHYVASRDACSVFFFFQAEDGIRDYKVTGVQTCALPILIAVPYCFGEPSPNRSTTPNQYGTACSATESITCMEKIGRASCRERV